jgi:hypothetical protein
VLVDALGGGRVARAAGAFDVSVLAPVVRMMVVEG